MSTDKAFEYLRQFYNPYHGKDGRFTTSRGGATVVPWGSPSGRGKSHPGAASGEYAAARASWKPRAEGGKFVSKTDGGPGKSSAPATPKDTSAEAAAKRNRANASSRASAAGRRSREAEYNAIMGGPPTRLSSAARQRALQAERGMGMDRERSGSRKSPSGGVGGWAEQGPGVRHSPDSGTPETAAQKAAKWAKISAGMANAARQKTLQAERQAAREAAKKAKLSDGMANAARQKTLRAYQ